MTNKLPCPHRMGGDQNMSDQLKSSGWVSVKERLPEANNPFYVANEKQVSTFINGISNPNLLRGGDWTHWQPWTLPALPQPPKPAAEVAWDKWANQYYGMMPRVGSVEAKAAFLAAIAWAKENKGAL